MIADLFRALVKPKRQQEIPPDLQEFEERRNELVCKIDAFGAMVRDMRAPIHKKPVVSPQTKRGKK